MASFVFGSPTANPIIDLRFVELPKPTNLVSWHLPFTNPLVDRVPFNPEMVCNLINGQPSIFHHFVSSQAINKNKELPFANEYQANPPHSTSEAFHPNKQG